MRRYRHLALAALLLLNGAYAQAQQDIGLYMRYGYEGTDHISNMKLTKDAGGQWQAERPIEWRNDDDRAANFYVYTPYNPDIEELFYGAYYAEQHVPADQRSDEAFQRAAAVMQGSTQGLPEQGMPQIKLHHCLAKLVINVVAGRDVSEADLRGGSPLAVKLENVGMVAAVNVLNGETHSLYGSPAVTVTPHQTSPLTWEAVVVPAQLDDAALSIVWNNTLYRYQFKDLYVDSARQYTLTVTINKKGQGGMNIGIGDWESTGEDYGGTVN